MAGGNDHIEIQTGDVPEDADSSFDDLASDTTSLKSSITAYRYENNRRYHAYKDGAYWGPNDEKAADHLDLAHHLYSMTLEGKLQLAPIEKLGGLHKVLDVGTGTGIWAIDFADTHEETEVIGTDLSPIQPGFVPPNVKFEIDDCEDEWTFPSNSFDFIHVRGLFGSVKDWPEFYAQVLRCLKPGGYFEQTEHACDFKSSDDSVKPGMPIYQWGQLGIEFGHLTGKMVNIIYTMNDKIKEAGFADVVENKYKWPVGTWPKDLKMKKLGAFSKVHIEEGLENWCLAGLTRVQGWATEEAHVLMAGVRGNLKDAACHPYLEMRVVYGRKPVATS